MKMRKELLTALLFGAAALILYGYRLGFPADMYYDEVYHVKTAREFLTLSGNTDTVHPPLGKILLALAIRIFGDHPWAWRLLPLLAGAGSVTVLFFIALRLTKNFPTACLSAFFFLVDGMSMTQARIAMLNAFMLFFMLLTFYSLIPHAVTGDWSRRKSFLLGGLFFGLAASTRWVSFGILSVVSILLVRILRPAPAEKKPKKSRSLTPVKTDSPWKDLIVFFGLVPLAIYVSAHLIIPVIYYHPQNFGEFLRVVGTAIWDYQTTMLNYHLRLTEGHNYGSAWWTWPLMTRPIWYFYEKPLDLVHGILCIGNPLIFWAIPLAMGATLWRLFKGRQLSDLLIAAGFFAQWLPWAFVSRVKFFHYFYACLPFLAMALAVLVRRVWQSGMIGKGAAVIYLSAVALMFAYWYPLYTAIPVSEMFFRQHMWFRSWI